MPWLGPVFAEPTQREGYCDLCNSPIVVRSDDQPETIRERLRIFREDTAPVIEFYEKLGLTQTIDASRDAEEVYKDILAVVY